MPSDTFTNGADDMVTIPQLGEMKWGDYDVSPSRMPLRVVREMIRRSVGHVLSGEVSSASGTEIKDLVEDGTFDSADSDAAKAKRKEIENEMRLDHIESFFDGSWGTSRRGPRGPRLDPVATLYKREVAKAVRKILADMKGAAVFDKDAKTWTIAVQDATAEGGVRYVVQTFDETVAKWESNPATEATRNALMQIATDTAAFNARQAAAAATVAGAEPAGISVV